MAGSLLARTFAAEAVDNRLVAWSAGDAGKQEGRRMEVSNYDVKLAAIGGHFHVARPALRVQLSAVEVEKEVGRARQRLDYF